MEKPSGRLLLLDARALNATLASYKYKQTTIADALRYCADKDILCVGDVVSYFFTIRVTPESQEYLGFQVGDKRYKFTRLPQGLKTAPQIASSLMGFCLRGLDVASYLDDVVMGGKTFDQLYTLLEGVLNRFRRNNLSLRPDKAVLFKKTVPLLGVIVEAGKQVRPDVDRFRPLAALKQPKSAKELKSTLCFPSYYRRYLEKFAIRTARYNDMANLRVDFKWEQSDSDEIERMYTHLITHAALGLFNENHPARLHVDASVQGVGGMLTQQVKGKGYYKPVGFFSQNLTKTQQKWSAFHLECLGFYLATKSFESE